MGTVVVLSAAALMIYVAAAFVGHETRTWGAVTWPLTVPVGLLALGSLGYVLDDDRSGCLEGCDLGSVLLTPLLFAIPGVVWAAGGLAGRLMRFARRHPETGEVGPVRFRVAVSLLAPLAALALSAYFGL